MKNVGPKVAVVVGCFFMDQCVYGFTAKVLFHMTHTPKRDMDVCILGLA